MNLKIKITDRAALLIKDILEAQDVKNGYLEIRVV
jgi:Fe-S cluster assembly iron-binding protein IscA